MLLSKLNFEYLENVTSADRWGANTARDRLLFRDENYYYKVWGKDYIGTTVAAIGSAFCRVEGLRGIHGFEVGLLRPDLCEAFCELITDEEGTVRGYITRRGKHPDQVPDEFVDRLFQASIDSGWLFSDLKEGNVVIVDGVYSLIDYDTHLTCLKHIDAEFEEKNGCLRPHVTPRYRRSILNYLANKSIR